ncbi:MAG: fibrobacter succinogenes major paralogous domain-containing protein, partial [Chitinispirillales bacterium]|nr:fibrobacter succinogenes major paralogous domain-containing protein [Chitinispirillales bacterium]
VAAAIAGAFAGEPSFGTFTDNRDGQTYKTVKIGTQTWMAQNINYQTKGGSWCYNNKADNCKKYGRLYDWMTAKTVCPKGWKLPSREDWDSLGQAVGGKRKPNDVGNIDWYGAGKKLKSKSGWKKNGNGTNDYGFSALPGGLRNYYNGSFSNAGYYGYWWTATEYDSGNAYDRNMYDHDDNVYEYDNDKDYGFSVRCVADNP